MPRVRVIKYSLGIFLALSHFAFASNFPRYIELDVGETVYLTGFPKIQLVSKKITHLEERVKGVRLGWVKDRIGAAEIVLRVDDETITVPVGYQNEDVVVGNIRIGAELISDFEERWENTSIHLEKDARIRIARAGEKYMPEGSHVFPLMVPWNNGLRNLAFLTVCSPFEENLLAMVGRYHDGFDMGTWEGQVVRSVCEGIVVSPDSYPEMLEKGFLYNLNDRQIGTNPFLVKHPDLPLLYYYTHLSGLARDFKEGDIVKKGEILGYASNRGRSGGWYHLHFSLTLIDQMKDINPFPFLAEWYRESMGLYLDFLSDFDVYYRNDLIASKRGEFEADVLEGRISPNRHYRNSLPGVVHLREAIADAPYSGLNHAVFDQFVILKGRFFCEEAMPGELWFGHTGIARLYLNGKLLFKGEDENPYDKSRQPLQVDSKMIQCRFENGVNEVVVAVEQTNPFWAFSIRPRTRLGLPLSGVDSNDASTR